MNSQGRRIISELKRKPHTYLEMQMLGISTSPQKRVAECLAEDERLIKGARWFTDGRRLTTWFVRKVKT